MILLPLTFNFIYGTSIFNVLLSYLCYGRKEKRRDEAFCHNRWTPPYFSHKGQGPGPRVWGWLRSDSGDRAGAGAESETVNTDTWPRQSVSCILFSFIYLSRLPYNNKKITLSFKKSTFFLFLRFYKRVIFWLKFWVCFFFYSQVWFLSSCCLLFVYSLSLNPSCI